MSYSNSYQSYIGVLPSFDAAFNNLIIENATVRGSMIEPSQDDKTDLGRPSKRYRSAYIDELFAGRIVQYDNNTAGKCVSSIIDSVPTQICVTEPGSKGVSGCIQMKTQVWTSANVSGVLASSANTCSKYIPALKKWFVIMMSLTNPNTYISINGGLSWTAGGVIPSSVLGTVASSDLAYSPELGILVFSASSSSGTGTPGIQTFYSRDEGITWTQCTFPTNGTNAISYGKIVWVKKYQLFLAFATISTASQNTLGLFSIMKSSDGINFTKTSVALPSVLTAFNSTTLGAIFSYDVDQSRGITCVGIRNSNNTTQSAVYYTEDGDTWVASNLHKISIRSNALYSKNGTFLPQNDKIDFIYSGNTYVATVSAGVYDLASLLTAVADAMNTAASSGTTITVTFNSSTGLITVSFNPAAGTLLWSSGANNTKGMWKELSFAKADTGSSTSVVGTVPVFFGRGFITNIAYSPPLDIWIAVGSNTGTIVSSNLAWADIVTDNNNPRRPNGFWYQPAIPKQSNGVAIPQFYACKWIDSFQMFFLLNGTPNYAGNTTTDRNIWYSTDGMNYYSTEASTGPKSTLTTTELGHRQLSFDDDNKVLIISEGTASTNIMSIYSFNSLLRQTSLMLPSLQVGVFSTPAVVTGAQTWTVVFDRPFAVAPVGVIATQISNEANTNNLLTWFVNSITTTGFNIVANASANGSIQNFSYIAWERP